MKLKSNVLTGSEDFAANLAANMAALETVREAAQAASRMNRVRAGTDKGDGPRQQDV